MILGAKGGTLGAKGGTLTGVGALGSLPQLFTLIDTSPATTDLGSAQGVALDAPGTTRWVTGGPADGGLASDGRSVIKYDASWAIVGEHNYATDLVGYSQVNGISLDRVNNLLYVGASNYPTTPKLGKVLVIDPATLALLASHDVGANWTEGGAIRPGTSEFWACYTDILSFRRYDTASSWALLGTYAGGFAAVTADSYYQGIKWFSPTVFVSGLHGAQVSPPTFDVFQYDPVGNTVTPLYRLDRPSTLSGQDFDFTGSKTVAYFAERDGGGANVDRVVRAGVTAVDLHDGTINAGSSQRTGLTHWYPVLRWNGSALSFIDEIGTAHGAMTDGAYVYPYLGDLGYRWVHFRGGNAGSRIEFGNLFPSALTSYTISFWYWHLDTSTNLPIINGNASGTNIGDWAIQANVGNPGRINVTSTAIGATTARSLTTDLADALSVGSKTLITVAQGTGGMTIYLNGVAKKTNALTGQISGNSQAVYAGSLFTGSGNLFRMRDLRIADSEMSAAAVAALYTAATRYDMWAA